MAEKPGKRALYTVACRCGAPMAFEAAAFGRARACPSCGSQVTVMWGLDPMGRERIPIVTVQAPGRAAKEAGELPAIPLCDCGYPRRVQQDKAGISYPCPRCGKRAGGEEAPAPKGKPSRPRKQKAAAPPPPQPLFRARVKHDASSFKCPCGERIPIPDVTGGKPVPCPACGRRYNVERKAPPPPAPVPEAVKPRGTTRRRAAETPPPPPAPPSPRLQPGEFLCECGAVQPPRTSRTGREFACSACGRKGRLEQKVDPVTQEISFVPVFTSGPG